MINSDDSRIPEKNPGEVDTDVPLCLGTEDISDESTTLLYPTHPGILFKISELGENSRKIPAETFLLSTQAWFLDYQLKDFHKRAIQ